MSPKSIRFNIKDFDAGMAKGGFESAQDMVDYLLRNYVQGEDVKLNAIKTGQDLPQKSVESVISPQKQLSKAEMFKMMREGKI